MSFPRGAYIFGDRYPVGVFNAFFEELKSFEPKYCDTTNSSLYFTKETAHKVHNAFWPILNKYREMVKEEVKRERIKGLETELESLKAKWGA